MNFFMEWQINLLLLFQKLLVKLSDNEYGNEAERENYAKYQKQATKEGKKKHVKPKDTRLNKLRTEKLLKDKLEYSGTLSKPEFKLKEFTNVPSKISRSKV